MISAHLKPSVVKFITPLCRGLLRMGITADVMTITGTTFVLIGSFALLAKGHLVAAIIVLGLSLLTDLLDGTMARISEKGASVWGNFLDSTLDRIADSAVLLGLMVYLHNQKDSLFIAVAFLLAISSLVPYARAKAESLNIECSGGFAERTERLILLGFFGLLYALGISWAMALGVWVLIALTALTVIQRMAIVWRATRA